MNINTLHNTTEKNRIAYQKEYLRIVKKTVKKYGMENLELKGKIKEAIKPLVIEMVKSGINLGLKFD